MIGISQSGASPDIVGVVAAARRQGAPTIAITNDPARSWRTPPTTSIDLGAGPELAVAATKTYTGELLAIALLAAAMAARPAVARRSPRSRTALAAALEVEPDIERIVADLAARDAGAPGRRRATSTRPRASGHSSSRSSPTSSQTRTPRRTSPRPPRAGRAGLPVLALAAPGAPAADLDALLPAPRRPRRRARSSCRTAPGAVLATRPVPLPEAPPEYLAPIVSIVPGQLHAIHLPGRAALTRRRRATSKVTRTIVPSAETHR